MIRYLAGLLLLLLPTAASAELYAEVQGWAILQNESDCTMVTEYEGGGTFYLTLDDRLSLATVAFSDPSVKSLKDGDTRRLDTYFSNGPSSTFDDGWKDKEYTVVYIDGVAFFARQMSDEFVADVARYRTLAFFYGDAILQSFSLEGSAAATQSLRKCARKVARTNPSDPFAGKAQGSQ